MAAFGGADWFKPDITPQAAVDIVLFVVRPGAVTVWAGLRPSLTHRYPHPQPLSRG